MTKLDKGTVIAAALELLNEVGMDSLTTRKLAERLKDVAGKFTGYSESWRKDSFPAEKLTTLMEFVRDTEENSK